MFNVVCFVARCEVQSNSKQFKLRSSYNRDLIGNYNNKDKPSGLQKKYLDKNLKKKNLSLKNINLVSFMVNSFYFK